MDIGENTTVGGQAFFDFSNISQTQGQANGTDPLVAPSGTGFDVKRFYLIVDHTFNDVFSADLTTDAQYASNTTVVTGATVTCTGGAKPDWHHLPGGQFSGQRHAGHHLTQHRWQRDGSHGQVPLPDRQA